MHETDILFRFRLWARIYVGDTPIVFSMLSVSFGRHRVSREPYEWHGSSSVSDPMVSSSCFCTACVNSPLSSGASQCWRDQLICGRHDWKFKKSHDTDNALRLCHISKLGTRWNSKATHIFDNFEAAPPVTLATRKPSNSCFSSPSCLVNSFLSFVRNSEHLTFPFGRKDEKK